jgi:hypothetical protein
VANAGFLLHERLRAPGSVGYPEFDVLVKIGLGFLSQAAPVESVCRYDNMCGKPFELHGGEPRSFSISSRW